MVSPIPGWVSMLTLVFCVSVAGCSATQDDVKAEYSKGQQLVIAAFELELQPRKAIRGQVSLVKKRPDPFVAFFVDSPFSFCLDAIR